MIDNINLEVLETIILDNCTYCAEPHQLSCDDLINEYDFDNTIKTISQKFNITINESVYNELTEIISDILSDVFYEDETMFLI